ncbi:hypothetical protein K439DRAFT_1638915 [Ramaria rubella]|nr:hypothetical protein K439DRAFT_1638915 [Ramaria rubella]
MHYVSSVSLFVLALASVSCGLNVINTGGASAEPSISLPEKCAGGEILDTTTLHVGEHDIKVTTRSCKGTLQSKRNARRSGLNLAEKRQINLCANPICPLTCESPNNPGAPPIDCSQLTTSFMALGNLTFTVPPEGITSFVLGQCGASLLNGDLIELESCFNTLGSKIAALSAACPTSIEAVCPSSIFAPFIDWEFFLALASILPE